MARTTILVYGFYGKGNIGDELFKEAFHFLFPYYNFIFTDLITKELLQNTSIVFFGGGSFLYAAPNITSEALTILKSKKIFYIGVGIEQIIHPIHQDLIKISKLVAIRSPEALSMVKYLNVNTIVIPDIVYALQECRANAVQLKKSVLVLPNFSVVPQWSDPNWKHAAWNYFKSEFSQFLDSLIESKHKLNFLSMCQNKETNDEWAATEIISQMKHRDNYLLSSHYDNIQDITKLFSQYSCIITQRFHGIVLSEITNTPYITIHHHDKLKSAIPHNGDMSSYYGLSKIELFNSFDKINSMNFSSTLPIDSNIFASLSQKIDNLIQG